MAWYEAFAFCLWDGAYLPTEAEWNLAASGGTNYRVYPWSTPSTSTSIDKTRAAYACNGDNNGAACALSDIVNLGTLTTGYSRWGQADLAGNIREYVLDYWSTTLPYPCSNCANVTVDSGWRGINGGSWLTFTTANLAAAARDRGDPLGRSNNVGFRGAWGLGCDKMPRTRYAEQRLRLAPIPSAHSPPACIVRHQSAAPD